MKENSSQLRSKAEGNSQTDQVGLKEMEVRRSLPSLGWGDIAVDLVVAGRAEGTGESVFRRSFRWLASKKTR